MELHGIGRSVGDRIRRKDDQLRNLLVPHEGRIMCLQSLLVWEQPQHSALLFVTVNLVFWFVTGLRFLVLSAIIGFCASTWSLWSNYIWPEIRVKRPDDDDEEWTPVHPRLLSVPELSLQLSTKIVSVEDVFTRAMTLRKTNPFKFFVFATTGFVTMGVFGHYVPGIYLSYGSMMAVLLLPMVWYHQLDVKFKEFLNPFVNKMEESMNIKRNRSKSSAKVKVSDTSESDEEIKTLQKNQPLLKMPSVRDSDSDATGLTPRLTPNLPEINLRLDEDADCEDPTDVSPRELPSMTSVTDTEGFPSQMPSVTSMAETMMSVDPRFDLASNSELTLADISDNESYAEGMRDEDLVLSEVDGRRSCQRKSPVARIPEDRPLDNPSPTPLEFVPHHFKADSSMTSTDSTESKKARKKKKVPTATLR